jgi:hypothetical protein
MTTFPRRHNTLAISNQKAALCGRAARVRCDVWELNGFNRRRWGSDRWITADYRDGFVL